jgi:NAD(P)-dependent dehydrogenase (short-subunit alcohol dehydrogenase family)
MASNRNQAAPGSEQRSTQQLEKPAGQTDPRHRYPSPPMPPQHLGKPSHEAQMMLQPEFLAAEYRGSGKLDGMVAIVTGGDSGIGRAVAVLFAREGAKVAVIYLHEHDDAAETKRCVEAEGCECLLLPGDVRDPVFCRNAARQVHCQFGRLDILVNNAAFQQHAAGLGELSEERFDLTMKTNVYGYFHMAQAVLPFMKQGASIVNTGSVTGLQGSGHLIDYATTKGAIHAFTKSQASNVLDLGIRVNAVAPGPVWTPLNPADAPPAQVSQFGADTDMHRPAQPQELSPAYVFLASPVCSSYITGTVLEVTGSVGG